MNPIRKPTAAGKMQTFQFDFLATRFLVKNLSGGDIVVGFQQDISGATEDTWLIPDGAWQIIPGAGNRIRRRTVYVLPKATSDVARGVEIEATEYDLPKRG